VKRLRLDLAPDAWQALARRSTDLLDVPSWLPVRPGDLLLLPSPEGTLLVPVREAHLGPRRPEGQARAWVRLDLGGLTFLPPTCSPGAARGR